MAKFYGIGTGPGDSKLVTMEAAERLGNLEILYTPQPKKGGESLAKKIVSPYLKDTLIIKERHFPMSYNKRRKNACMERNRRRNQSRCSKRA